MNAPNVLDPVNIDGTLHVQMRYGVLLLDERDAWVLPLRRWNSRVQGHTAYVTAINPFTALHRVLIDAPKGLFVDHINGNGMDNRRHNLRVCTHRENQQNRRKLPGGTSRFLGVSRRPNGKWSATIQGDYLGVFETEEQAAETYRLEAIRRYGEFTPLHVLEPVVPVERGA